jgi:hypothetical protein
MGDRTKAKLRIPAFKQQDSYPLTEFKDPKCNDLQKEKLRVGWDRYKRMELNLIKWRKKNWDNFEFYHNSDIKL